MDAALCCEQRCTPSGGMAQPTSRQGRASASVLRTQAANQIIPQLPLPGRHLARPQHRMHRNSQSPGDGDGRAFKSNALPQFEPPWAQRAVG